MALPGLPKIPGLPSLPSIPKVPGLDTAFKNINVADKVSGFKSDTATKLAGYRADAVKAISPVSNKLKEGVALVKSTESKVTKVITGYKDEVVNNLNSIIGSLSGGMLDFSDAKRYISIGKGGVGFNSDLIVSDLGAKMGLDLSSKGALMNQMAQMANTEFGQLTGGVFGNMVTGDGSGFRITSNWRDQLGTSLIGMLQRTTGLDNKLLDDTFNISFYNSVLTLSAKYGMSDSFKSIYDKYTYPEDAKAAMIQVIPTLMENGDLISMNKVLELVGKEKYPVINAKYPGLIAQLFQNFVLDPGVTVGSFPEIKAMFLKVCVSIFGPNWYKRQTAFGFVYDLGLVGGVSDDIKKVMMSDETYPELIPFLCCAGQFNEQKAFEVFKQHFPDVPLIDV